MRLDFSKNASFVRCKTCGIQKKCLFWFLVFAEKRWAGWAENSTLDSFAETYKINKATCEIVSFRNFSSLSVSPFFDKFFTEYTMFQDADWSDEVIFHDIWTLKKYPILSLPGFIDIRSSSSMQWWNKVEICSKFCRPFLKNISLFMLYQILYYREIPQKSTPQVNH